MACITPDIPFSDQMKEVATENFQRICEAYEILTDENKRMIYDIYGMEGLTSGLELGPKLNKVDEIKEELERLRRQREQEKFLASIQSSGSILASLSWPDFLIGDGIMKGYDLISIIIAASLLFLNYRVFFCLPPPPDHKKEIEKGEMD